MRRIIKLATWILPLITGAALLGVLSMSVFATDGAEEGVVAQEVESNVAMCFGLPATIVGTGSGDFLVGTPGDDVIQGFSGVDCLGASIGALMKLKRRVLVSFMGTAHVITLGTSWISV